MYLLIKRNMQGILTGMYLLLKKLRETCYLNELVCAY